MRLKISEIDLHRSVADFLNWMLLPPAMWTTFPAGWTAMRKGAAGRLRGCGLKAGMPDILVFCHGSTIGVELKAGTKLSPAQEDMHDKLRKAGVFVFVVRNLEELHHELAGCHVPMKEFTFAQSNKTPKIRRPKKPAQGESLAA